MSIQAAIDKSDLTGAASLIQANRNLARQPIQTNMGVYPTPLSYLLYKLSLNKIVFKGLFTKDLKPLRIILQQFKEQSIGPSPGQDVDAICKRITDKNIKKVISEFYNTNCNPSSYPQSQYNPGNPPSPYTSGYPPSHYNPGYSPSPYTSGYPQNPYTPGYPQSPYLQPGYQRPQYQHSPYIRGAGTKRKSKSKKRKTQHLRSRSRKSKN